MKIYAVYERYDGVVSDYYTDRAIAERILEAKKLRYGRHFAGEYQVVEITVFDRLTQSDADVIKFYEEEYL